ncbi:hypothetical protein VP01_2637g2 [Puccinia sorghi]|uniref:Major facilitator superfamily (MFS) profile domain-containing protein n=1 Tax=Puccinia sorghi TaxID=27349 RepID=A0A0L6V4Z3_9BASI|nr:hypothetical protein VP01_2637g2 [Puccinia sorghi]
MSLLFFLFNLLWILISAFSYGYHISALNGAQDVITCRSTNSNNNSFQRYPSLAFLVPCIPMSDTLFGFITASYPIGGFIGSVCASKLIQGHRGKRNSLFISALSIGLGSLLMSLSNFVLPIIIGRTIIGFGCGINTVIVPIYLSEISPLQIRGSVGVMNQLAIVIGIFFAQLVSLPLSSPFIWRWIFIISFSLSSLQLLTTPFIPSENRRFNPNQPSQLNQEEEEEQEQEEQEEEHNEQNISTSTHQPTSRTPHQSIPSNSQHLLERETLLTPTHTDHNPLFKDGNTLSVAQLLQQWKRDPTLADGLKIVLITQLAQQLSGIKWMARSNLFLFNTTNSAVLYYSTSIMKSVLPTQAIYISLFITAINVIMTFPPIFLVDKLGRKSLLLISASSMAITSLLLGISINYEVARLSSLAIVLFVASFSIGLGPIPFVILSEVVPSYAVSASGSLGLALNWASNFLVGLIFLPLRNVMSSPDGDGDGNVFYIFTILGAISTCLIYRTYKHPAC